MMAGHFAKTGSGQTSGELILKELRLCEGLAVEDVIA